MTSRHIRTNISTRLFLVISGIIIIAVSTSCSLDWESNVESGNRDQILHYGNGEEPQEIDPHLTTGIPEFNIQLALFEGIVSKHPSNLGIEPGVAESWDISEDQLIYTFHFRDNARWSNGDPVTAHDFVYSWERALRPELGSLYSYMFIYIKNADEFVKGKIKDFSKVGIKALDERTLQVELNAATPFFLQLLDHHSYYPVHPPTIEKFGGMLKRGSQWSRPGNFVGNGSFVLKEWKLNRILIVEKSKTYWDADKVKLKEIYFYPVQNNSTEERMFRAGQLHITSTVPNEKIAEYRKTNPDSLNITPYLGTYFYRFNTKVKPLDDVRVRRALSMSINRKQIVEHITKGGQIPAYTFTPPNTNGFTSVAKFKYDIEAAQKLLVEAGYPDGKDFPNLEIIYNTDESHRMVAIAIQQMWKKALNINVTLANQDWQVYLENETQGNYQISRAGWIGDYLDPNNFLDMLLTDGGNNRTRWSNSEYDANIAAAALAVEKEERFKLFQRNEQILVDESPVMPIYTYTRVFLIKPSVIGWDQNILDQHPYKYVSLQAD
ncbi:MAG: peptide ABC transporter substrate-binding protein [Gammaproteobacteria bacterium]|nr:peptide ABC transporter substrate-binding protein [Gammaproteobacteria bacterium]